MAELLVTAGAMKLLNRASRVALICHMSPDADCVGGMMAMTHALRSLGREVHPLAPDPIPDYLLHVPGSSEVKAAVAQLPEVDLVITIEAASLERTEPIYSNARAQLDRTPVLNIDHHASNTGYGTERIFDPRAAAVCEILYRVIRDLGVPLDDAIAYSLLTGIIGDTRSFRTSSTTPQTLEVASALIAAGAPLGKVSDAVSKHRTAAEIGVWADALGRARCEHGILWTSVTEQDAQRHGLTLDQIDGLVEFLSDTRDIAVSALFKETAPGRVRVSLRSDGRVDLTKIASLWGGGGHPQASGCTLAGVGLAEAEEAVIGAVKLALSR